MKNTHTPQRIQKFLANLGIASRREIETMITAERIKLNGKLAKLGDHITENDHILIDNKKINLKPNKAPRTRLIMYNKPEGEICTRKDDEGRTTVFEKLPSIKQGRWIGIGRLDINSSGLLLFTNDGELAHKLMHPSFAFTREYSIRVLGDVDAKIIKNLSDGVMLEDGLARFHTIKAAGGNGANRWYRVTLREGRNREIRRMFESQGVKVNRLIRTQYGNIVLPRDLPQGTWREVPGGEIQLLL